MDIKKIQELLKIVEKHEKISEFSFEEKSTKIHIKMYGSHVPTVHTSFAPSALVHTPLREATTSPASDKKYIKSPIVGTFYSKSSPDAPAFVKVGDKVQANTIVCIIESMKVFNEVEAEVDGVIKEVLLKDGTPVEHGQPLFVIE